MRFLNRDRTLRVDRNASPMGPASIDICIIKTGSERVRSLPAQRFKKAIGLSVVAAASTTSRPQSQNHPTRGFWYCTRLAAARQMTMEDTERAFLYLVIVDWSWGGMTQA